MYINIGLTCHPAQRQDGRSSPQPKEDAGHHPSMAPLGSKDLQPVPGSAGTIPDFLAGEQNQLGKPQKQAEASCGTNVGFLSYNNTQKSCIAEMGNKENTQIHLGSCITSTGLCRNMQMYRNTASLTKE